MVLFFFFVNSQFGSLCNLCSYCFVTYIKFAVLLATSDVLLLETLVAQHFLTGKISSIAPNGLHLGVIPLKITVT